MSKKQSLRGSADGLSGDSSLSAEILPSIISPQPAAKIPAPKIGSIVIARVETEPVARTQFGMVSIGDAQAAAGTTIDWRSVSIFEAAAGGLYIASEAGVRPVNFVALPN